MKSEPGYLQLRCLPFVHDLKILHVLQLENHPFFVTATEAREQQYWYRILEVHGAFCRFCLEHRQKWTSQSIVPVPPFTFTPHLSAVLALLDFPNASAK